MKKIFDWMREEINATIGVELFGEEYTGIKRVNRIINEAEAKWEVDCCEHKWNREYGWYDTSCGHILEPHGYNFCPYCGKPIKISEVE